MRPPILFLVFVLAIPARSQMVFTFALDQPARFLVDAGEDVTYFPGLTLEASVIGGTGVHTFSWTPAEFLDDPTSATPQVVELPGGSTFSVEVTDIGLGCAITDEVHVDLATGVPVLGSAHIWVHPNPTDGLVRLRSGVARQRIQLRSSSGALVLEHPGTAVLEQVIDLSAVPSGFYILKVELADGSFYTSKLCVSDPH